MTQERKSLLIDLGLTVEGVLFLVLFFVSLYFMP